MKVASLKLSNFLEKYPTQASILLAAIFVMVGLILNGYLRQAPSEKSRYYDCVHILSKSLPSTEEGSSSQKAKDDCFRAFQRRMWTF